MIGKTHLIDSYDKVLQSDVLKVVKWPITHQLNISQNVVSFYVVMSFVVAVICIF